MDNAAVTQHYNERRDEGRTGRQDSRIIKLRSFNNWIKSVLIQLHTRPGARVLDLCSGKGGDMNKWDKARISAYVACDTAPVSVQQAAERYNSMSGATFRPIFLVGDCFAVRLTEFLPDDALFDVVSCQFAMHYAFESEARVRQMLVNVTERLRPGGFFIGTTTDANVIVKKFRAIDAMEIKNAVCRVELDDGFKEKRFAIDSGSQYGIRYSFTLDQNVEDCPEYLVHFPSLKEVAAEYELELVLLCNFHDFCRDYSSDEYPQFKALFQRMVFGKSPDPMSPDEWDTVYLYTAFAFKKVGDACAGIPDASGLRSTKWEPVDESEIVNMNGKDGESGCVGSRTNDDAENEHVEENDNGNESSGWGSGSSGGS